MTTLPRLHPVPEVASVRVLTRDAHVTLVCAGELDLAVRGQLEQAVARVLSDLRDGLVVDLGRVALLDCASARLVLRTVAEARRRDVRVLLVCPEGRVLQVLDHVAGHAGQGVAGARLLRTRGPAPGPAAAS